MKTIGGYRAMIIRPRGARYVLIDQTCVPELDRQKWEVWWRSTNTTIRQTWVGPSVISTFFLGIDYREGQGAPVLFESLIFTDGSVEAFQLRATTWQEAIAQHERLVNECRNR